MLNIESFWKPKVEELRELAETVKVLSYIAFASPEQLTEIGNPTVFIKTEYVPLSGIGAHTRVEFAYEGEKLIVYFMEDERILGYKIYGYNKDYTVESGSGEILKPNLQFYSVEEVIWKNLYDIFSLLKDLSKPKSPILSKLRDTVLAKNPYAMSGIN